jgi:valyl-tRNA synthetase
MIKELDKAYNPSNFEDLIYSKWEESGFFNPDNLELNKNTPSYTIILPPPNITDKLHMGHSVMLAIEDILIRWHRQRGFKTLWLPGTDHAAIATQNAVEKKILKEKGLTRHDLGRKKFLREVFSFVEDTQAIILKQIKKMGASLDWSRLAFTLDEKRQKAVKQMFVDMYKAGAIYRGKRIVNWCPHCQSTLSDDEVEYKEKEAKLYTFYYSHELPIAISTTRPETKLGDTAIAISPKDDRYSKYKGKNYKLDFLGINLNLKIIEDFSVDKDFGSGALGVTPAHSLVDWNMAQKHDLSIIQVIDERAKIKLGFGKYSNLDVLSAREKIVEDLKKNNLLIKEEIINNNLSICYRCGATIEPLLSKQWFVAVNKPLKKLNNKSLKEAALAVVEKNEIEFIPTRFKSNYLNWMNNLHDWCISRQIDFGHSLPVWYNNKENDVYVGLTEPKGNNWTKDKDTLDTWFSSGMWTFSTLGWPDNFIKGEKSGDLVKFHPTQVLETGYEIITLWVSRMIMMSLFALNEIPFSQVYLHGMILDEKGKKMSKSKGNGVDPLELIEKYGADAVRLSLLTGSTPGTDSRYSEEKVENKRNFINKFWNIARFILNSIDGQKINNKPEIKTLADRWILHKFLEIVLLTNKRLENKEFSLAIEELINFTWNDLANWYLEIVKIEKNKEDILSFLLTNLLRLWHPFAPYVTETIWQSWQKDLLMIQKYPEEKDLNDLKEKIKEDSGQKNFKLIQDIIVAIRDARNSHKIEPAKKITALIITSNKLKLLKKYSDLIKNLKTNLKELEIKEKAEAPSEAIFIGVAGIEIYLSQTVNKKQERDRLLKEKKNITNFLTSIEKKLNNQGFIENAPKAIVEAENNKLVNWQEQLNKLNNKLKNLS